MGSVNYESPRTVCLELCIVQGGVLPHGVLVLERADTKSPRSQLVGE